MPSRPAGAQLNRLHSPGKSLKFCLTIPAQILAFARKSPAKRIPRWIRNRKIRWLLIVLVVAVLGQVLDIRDSLKDGHEIKPDNHWTDIWNTMLVPTVLLIAARYTSIFEQPLETEAASTGDAKKGAELPPSSA